jgi:hypothetical protein
VGPVHAGIIEPGHFRFQCAGEEVIHLEIRLGYQHRGVEALLASSGPARRAALAESIAGDMAVAHAMAHAEAIEGSPGGRPRGPRRSARSPRAGAARDHTAIGRPCGDVGYLPGASGSTVRGGFLTSC